MDTALIAVALVALANLAAVRLYGEIEFWFAMIKVTTIIVMIVIGLGVIFFGFGNGGQSIGFSNLTGAADENATAITDNFCHGMANC